MRSWTPSASASRPAYVTDPPPETVGDDEISYTLTGVTLEYRPLGGGAFTPVDDLYGVWLLEGAAPADDPTEAETGGDRVTTKLEVWGRTPFSYEDHTTSPTLSTIVLDDPGVSVRPGRPHPRLRRLAGGRPADALPALVCQRRPGLPVQPGHRGRRRARPEPGAPAWTARSRSPRGRSWSVGCRSRAAG